MLNNDYVTPDNVRAATAPFVDNARYFTDGDDRPPFYGAWQPRLGFSYDLTGQGQTVAVRRLGTLLRSRPLQLDARRALPACSARRARSSSRATAASATAFRRSSGIRRTERRGSRRIIAQGARPNPEVFLIANDTKPPVSDQWSLGARQTVGRS